MYLIYVKSFRHLRRLWMNFQWPLKLLQVDNKYNKVVFHTLCNEWNIELHIETANHREDNSAIKRANRSFFISFSRLCASVCCTCLDGPLEVTYGKDLMPWFKLTFLSKVLFAVQYRVSDQHYSLFPPLMLVSAHSPNTISKQVNLMLRAQSQRL